MAMAPNQYLFDAVSTMTGGLINDTRTLYLGAVVLGFILMGLDHIKDSFEHFIEVHAYTRSAANAQEALTERGRYARGTFEYDEANRVYHHYLSKSVKSRLKM